MPCCQFCLSVFHEPLRLSERGAGQLLLGLLLLSPAWCKSKCSGPVEWNWPVVIMPLCYSANSVGPNCLSNQGKLKGWTCFNRGASTSLFDPFHTFPALDKEVIILQICLSHSCPCAFAHKFFFLPRRCFVLISPSAVSFHSRSRCPSFVKPSVFSRVRYFFGL